VSAVADQYPALDKLRVEVRLGAPAAAIDHLDRVLSQFEGFCAVAQSAGRSVSIEVSVFDGAGARLK
jgi:hypothetical protein